MKHLEITLIDVVDVLPELLLVLSRIELNPVRFAAIDIRLLFGVILLIELGDSLVLVAQILHRLLALLFYVLIHLAVILQLLLVQFCGPVLLDDRGGR